MSLKHAILTMLDIEKSSGYDLMKRFDQSVGFFWPSTFQQVYRDLTVLEEKGFVTAEEVEQEGKPDKKIYEITPLGIEELVSWLKKPAKEMKIKDTLLIKLFGGHRMKKADLLADVELQQQEHQENLDHYTDIMNKLDELEEPLYSKYRLPYQTLELGVKFENSWLEWCEEMKANLDELEDLFTPPTSD